MLPVQYTIAYGNGQATNAAASKEVIAAPSSGALRVQRGVVNVTTAATGGGGVVSLKNGTTVFAQFDGNAVGNNVFDFGDVGYPLTALTALNLVVESAATTQATAYATVVGYVA